MKKILALLTLAVLVSSPIVKAETIETDNEATDLSIMINAQLANSYRVTISNADMAVLAGQESGLVELGGTAAAGVDFDALDSMDQNACVLANGAVQVYTGAITCSFVGNGDTMAGTPNTISGSKLRFDAQFAVLVEVAGSARIDLIASRQGPQEVGRVAFSESAINFDAALPGAAALIGMPVSDGPTTSLQDRGDQSAHVLHWAGAAKLNEGPSFQEVILVDVVLDVVGDGLGSL